MEGKGAILRCFGFDFVLVFKKIKKHKSSRASIFGRDCFSFSSTLKTFSFIFFVLNFEIILFTLDNLFLKYLKLTLNYNFINFLNRKISITF